MTNREHYITRRDEYDLMMAISENVDKDTCPIEVVGGESCRETSRDCSDCSECLQNWLNAEMEP